ncbi:MAG TPA: hypothetical protein VK250_07420 [Nitrososphaeraceae archaeon]|nr:hypothetical protein [Nitrososphaeraceae archaeon]
MNITKYSVILSAILIVGIVAMTFSSSFANVQANEDYKYKKNINVQKDVCINKNVNINGETVFSSPNEDFPHCFNLNINSQNSDD